MSCSRAATMTSCVAPRSRPASRDAPGEIGHPPRVSGTRPSASSIRLEKTLIEVRKLFSASRWRRRAQSGPGVRRCAPPPSASRLALSSFSSSFWRRVRPSRRTFSRSRRLRSSASRTISDDLVVVPGLGDVAIDLAPVDGGDGRRDVGIAGEQDAQASGQRCAPARGTGRRPSPACACRR